MFISYNWLRELTNIRLNPEEVRERLTNVGLAVDAVEQRGDDYVLDGVRGAVHRCAEVQHKRLETMGYAWALL